MDGYIQNYRRPSPPLPHVCGWTNLQVFTIIYLFSWAFITMQAESGGTEGTHMTLALLLFPL